MSLDNASIAELKRRNKKTPFHLQLDLIDYQSYEQFADIVNKSINYIFLKMSRRPELYGKMGENQLTGIVVDQLDTMGFIATFDTSNGGHCDVLVQGDFEHQWIGEAKITTDYAWVLKGFNQLNTRYSSGDPDSARCGMLLYCKQKNVPRFIEKWRETLKGSDYDLVFQDCGRYPNAFISKHIHQKTGVEITVRHIPLPLAFDPKDKEVI